MKATDFYSTHVIHYPERVNHLGFCNIKVLEFLRGRPWDDIALGFVHALRPSGIRVTHGETKLDAMTWRVTVYVDEGNVITDISQEVAVWLPDGVEHGADLQSKLKRASE